MSTTTEIRSRPTVGGVVLGGVGGLISGIVFAVVTMWFMVSTGKPAMMPMHMIASIVQGEQALMAEQTNPMLGAVIHMVLSIMFGIVFALLVAGVRTNGGVAIAGLVYGLGLYVVNFVVLANLFFGAFLQANQPFELTVHVMFGVILALFLFSSEARRGESFWGITART